MGYIVAGYLQQQDQVNEVINQLVGSGFAKEKISAFYVNPPGQHDLYPIGGDQDESPGAKESADGLATGITTGSVIGAALGSATTPLVGPLGPITGGLVGAHIGSLVGSMSSMKDKGDREEGDATNTKPQRHSGMVVAIDLADSTMEGDVIRVLQTHGADQIERAQGHISNGDWVDFDPLTPPTLIMRKAPSDA